MTLTRHTAAAALLTTGVLHVAGLLYVSDRDVLAPLASVALMTASVVALAAAYLGVFINTAERVIRPETGLSFGAGIVALLASALPIKQRAELRQGTDLPTPGIEQRDIAEATDEQAPEYQDA